MAKVINTICIWLKKINGFTNEPLEGVHFELHKEKTVGNVTSFDLVPVVGFEDVVVQQSFPYAFPHGLQRLHRKQPDAHTDFVDFGQPDKPLDEPSNHDYKQKYRAYQKRIVKIIAKIHF